MIDDVEENKPSAVCLQKCGVKMTLSQLQDTKCIVVRSRSVQLFKLLDGIKMTLRQKTAIERTARRDGGIILKVI